MAALIAPRDTEQLGFSFSDVLSMPVKGATTIFQGGIVVLDVGFAKPGVTAAGLITVGRAEETVINAGADGAKFVQVRRGIMKYGNSAAGDAVAQAEVFGPCYVVDDATVMKTAAGKSVAGKVIKVDAATDPGGAGVWVEMGNQ